jgi:hypothetical protein
MLICRLIRVFTGRLTPSDALSCAHISPAWDISRDILRASSYDPGRPCWVVIQDAAPAHRGQLASCDLTFNSSELLGARWLAQHQLRLMCRREAGADSGKHGLLVSRIAPRSLS